MLLPTYKNELFKLTNTEGFSPSDFSINDNYEIPIKVFIGSKQYGADLPFKPPILYGLRLGYRDTKFEFIIEYHKSDFHQFSGYFTSFTPDYSKIKFPFTDSYCNYKHLEEFVKIWFKEIKEYQRQISEPDLWSSVINKQIFTNDSFDDNYDDFTEVEKETLRLAISKLGLAIKQSFEMNQKQNEYVKERLKYLTDSVDRLNKFDWKGTLLTTMISISVNLSVDTQRGTILFGLFQSAFVGLGHWLQIM